MAAVVLFLMVAAGVGFALHLMSQQAGRCSHWFVLAQQAHGLADDALRQAAAVLERPGAAGRDALVTALSRAGSARVTVLSSADPRSLTPALREQLAATAAGTPVLEVTAALMATGPLWSPDDPELCGLIPDPRERKGRLRLTARASVTRASAPRVERTLVLECDFRLVSTAPPLLGRFVLWVDRAPGEARAPAARGVRFDPLTGDGVTASDALPLTVHPASGVPVVDAETGRLDRGGLTAAWDAAGADRPGWIYLGGGAGPWRIEHAHGHTGTGESPLLATWPRRARYRGNDADDAAFRERFARAYRDATGCALAFRAPEDGLLYTEHGLADGAEAIASDAGPATVTIGEEAPVTQRSWTHALSMRLFGTMENFAPTLVFGPVLRVLVRRASVRATRGDDADASCGSAGTVVHPLHRLAAHGPSARRVITAAFGTAEDVLEHGTGVVEEPYAHALAGALDGAVTGHYTRSGLLDPDEPGRPPALRSRLLPWFERPAGTAGLSPAVIERLWNAEPCAPELMKGNLSLGMRAFVAALDRKLAARLDRRTAARLPDGPRLDLPGVVLIDSEEPYHLRAVETVTRGGIMVTRGRLVLDGDVRRGPGGEPLTLVSLTGDVVIGPRVRTVEAYLVAPRGTVRLPDGPLRITGGLACHRLDADALRRGSSPRSLHHDSALDPVAGGPLTLAFGGDIRLAAASW